LSTTTHTTSTAQARALAAYNTASPDLADYLRALDHLRDGGRRKEFS